MQYKWIWLVGLLAILTGCGEENHNRVAETTNAHVSMHEKRNTPMTAATKKTATKLAKEATKAASDAVESVQKSTEKTFNAAKEELSKVVVAQAPGNAGKVLYTKCAGCHGADGKRHALGKSALLAGQSASELADKLKAYKAGTRDTAGMGKLMKAQVASLSKRDILALAEYISTFK